MTQNRDFVETVKNALRIEDIIGKTIQLYKESGETLAGAISPSSKSGSSLKVDVKNQIFHDFASNLGGDVFNWIAYANNLDTHRDFPKVLHIAADFAGIPYENNITPEQLQKAAEAHQVFDNLTKAAEVYHNNLTPELREYIHNKWGITDETIDSEKIGYASPDGDTLTRGGMTIEELKNTGLVIFSKDRRFFNEFFQGRIIFPTWNNGQVVYFAARGDKENLGTPDNKYEDGKYKKLLTHTDEHEFVSEAVKNYNIWGEDTLRGKDWCVITEGVADAVILKQNNIPVLSPVTTRFSHAQESRLVDIAKRCKTVYIANDNELSGAGERGAITTGKLLKAEGVDVRIVILPADNGEDKVDVAEYFLKHNVEEFNSLLKKATPILRHLLGKIKPDEDAEVRQHQAEEFIKNNLLALPENDALGMIEATLQTYFKLSPKVTSIVKKYYKNEKKQNNKAQNVEKFKEDLQSEGGISPEFDGLYEIKVDEDTNEVYIYPKHDQIAYRVIENLNVVNYSSNCFCYLNGYYQNNMVAVKAETMRILTGICQDVKSQGIKNRADDVLLIARNTNPVYDYPFNKRVDAIPVKNGVVVFDFENNKINLESHDPKKWKFNYILPIIYNDKETSSVLVEELKKYTTDWRMLIQAIAQALLQKMGYGPYKKAYLLKGAKDCGKTTFLDILERIIGADNRSSVPLNELTPTFRFSKASMEGKLFNIDDDLGFFKMSETGVFKKITGGTKQRIERKGVDPYDIILDAVHMFTTNTPAGFDQKIFMDDAFWSRWCYIEFNHTFEKDDAFKKRVLTDENISGLFNYVLVMVQKIREMKELPFQHYWFDVREKWAQESNVLFKFVEDNMVSGGRTAIIKEDLLAALTKYCSVEKYDNSKVPQSVYALAPLVELIGGEKDARRIFKGFNNGHATHCYILNYTWKTDSSYAVYARKEDSTFAEELYKKAQQNKSIEADEYQDDDDDYFDFQQITDDEDED